MIRSQQSSGVVQMLDTPRQRQVAVMFADLDHFTRMCAEDPPELVFRLVRDFQHVVATSVARYQGRLGSYLGDGAMAIFSDLAGRTDCATRALRCAQAVLEGIELLNLEHIDAGGRSVSISIGLQYGQTLVGTITASRRFGPTVIGDPVNVAHRIEQRARTLGAKIVVGDDLIQRVRTESKTAAFDLAKFAHVGALSVDGRGRPVDVWILANGLNESFSPMACVSILGSACV